MLSAAALTSEKLLGHMVYKIARLAFHRGERVQDHVTEKLCLVRVQFLIAAHGRSEWQMKIIEPITFLETSALGFIIFFRSVLSIAISMMRHLGSQIFTL